MEKELRLDWIIPLSKNGYFTSVKTETYAAIQTSGVYLNRAVNSNNCCCLPSPDTTDIDVTEHDLPFTSTNTAPVN